jgi:hypothetical protein
MMQIDAAEEQDKTPKKRDTVGLKRPMGPLFILPSITSFETTPPYLEKWRMMHLHSHGLYPSGLNESE